MSFLTFMCANYNINTTDTLWQYFRTWKQREFFLYLQCYFLVLPVRLSFLLTIVYHHIVGKEFNHVDSDDVYHIRVVELSQVGNRTWNL